MTDLQRRCAADNNILIQGDKLLVNDHPLTVGSQVILKNTATQDTHKYVCTPSQLVNFYDSF